MSGTVFVDPNDPNPAVRAEYMAALAILAPEILGLHMLHDAAVANPSLISPDLDAVIVHQITLKERRRGYINAVLTLFDNTIGARNTLAADGYPGMSSPTLDAPLITELQGDQAALLAAIAVFRGEQQISVGPMTLTANPDPPTKSGP